MPDLKNVKQITFQIEAKLLQQHTMCQILSFIKGLCGRTTVCVVSTFCRSPNDYRTQLQRTFRHLSGVKDKQGHND